MSRSILKVVLLAAAVVAGWVGLNVYEKRYSSDRELNEEREKRKAAEARAEQLNLVVQHLESEQRVADIVVLDQQRSPGGEPQKTTLLFQELGKAGQPLPPKLFTIEGNEAHIDAMIIKFEGRFVEGRDPLRGRSIALFTKLFDSKQSPDKAYPIDDPGRIPAIYQGADPKVSEFEQQLWKDFWKLAQDKSYRQQMGVDVIQGKSVWWRFDPGYVYTLSMQPNADLVLRYEPMKPTYREMFNQLTAKVKAGQMPITPPATVAPDGTMTTTAPTTGPVK